ncbi:MAG: flagellar assembly protein FliW [Deltaproteobacteria bacterium]|nr:flagellar assembly protein FliW [Deltaproteobacteria bacterium]
MKFDTTRFGQIEVKSDNIVIFPEGPLGFPECTRFTLMDEDKAAPFRMLQSLDSPSLAFVVIDPLLVRPDYHFNVTREDLAQIKAEAPDDLIIYTIVTMSRDIREVTVNLQGPLVINPECRLGHQFVLVDSEYTTREKLIQNQDELVQTPSVPEGDSASKTEQRHKKAV